MEHVITFDLSTLENHLEYATFTYILEENNINFIEKEDIENYKTTIYF